MGDADPPDRHCTACWASVDSLMGDTVRVVKDCPYPFVASARFNSLVAATFSSLSRHSRRQVSDSRRAELRANSMMLCIGIGESRSRHAKYSRNRAIDRSVSVATMMDWIDNQIYFGRSIGYEVPETPLRLSKSPESQKKVADLP